MYLYNVTYKIDEDIERDWLQWMRSTHIPKVVRMGQFLGHRICKLIGLDESDGITYAIQYMCPDIPTFQAYRKQYADEHQTIHAKQFLNKYVSFSTILEIIE
ncbi:MAG: DUF4286 family protein [Bacteroidota bacterium]